MAVLTIDELKALDFGYLTGADLAGYCPPDLLISRYQILGLAAFNSGVLTAYSEIINKLSTRYDIVTEYINTGILRETTLVKITSLFAIRNIMGSSQNIGKVVSDNIGYAETDVSEVRNGQMSLQLNNAPIIRDSIAFLVPSSFYTRG